jgi:hypothetical protein
MNFGPAHTFVQEITSSGIIQNTTQNLTETEKKEERLRALPEFQLSRKTHDAESVQEAQEKEKRERKCRTCTGGAGEGEA